jgi:hypothetical protein
MDFPAIFHPAARNGALSNIAPGGIRSLLPQIPETSLRQMEARRGSTEGRYAAQGAESQR